MIQTKIVSLNTGMPGPLAYQNKQVSSGIFKRPVKEDIYLSRTQLDVCVYPYEHHAYWENKLSIKLDPGAFG